MINPIEQQLQRYWDRIQRALQVLQKAQRYDLAYYATGAVMERCNSGDYVDADDVVKAIQILQGGGENE